MKRLWKWPVSTALLLAACAAVSADDAKPKPAPRPAAQNLENPSGVAIHPETGHIFIAERRGVLRLFPQTDPEKKGFARKFEVNGYPTDVYGKGPMYDIGPLGVAFLGNDHLIVADGSRPDAEELVRVYKIGAEAPERPTKEPNAAFTLGPIGPGETSAKGEGNFYAIAVSKNAIYVTSNGDDTKGWVLRSELKDGKPGPLQGFIATKSDVDTDAPCGITLSPQGDLIVGQMGEITVPNDSLLLVYGTDGKLKKKYSTGLHDLVGLAYSPATGKLYGVDFAWADTTQGGLYELTLSGDACKTRKVCDLDKPTAIAFDKNGHAFVTIIGTAEEGATTKPGKLIRVPKGAL